MSEDLKRDVYNAILGRIPETCEIYTDCLTDVVMEVVLGYISASDPDAHKTANAPTAGPYSIGSAHWPGLSKVIEETGEMLQVIGKLIGTGGQREHWDGKGDLKQRLGDETADVLAATQFMDVVCDLHAPTGRVEEKYALFLKWHEEQGGK